MAISEAETSTAPVLLKESDIPETSLAGRKPAEFGKANVLFWQRFKRDRENITGLHQSLLSLKKNTTQKHFKKALTAEEGTAKKKQKRVPVIKDRRRRYVFSP